MKQSVHSGLKLAFSLAAFAALAAAPAAHAQTQAISLFDTGVNAAGMSLPNGTIGDPHYTLVANPAGTSDVITILTSAHADSPVVPGGWLADSTTSAWIIPNNMPFLNNGHQGYYDYQTTFDLTGLNPATATITGNWAMDNFGTDLLINGVSTGNAAASNNSYTPFTVASGFKPGVNTLDFVVLDDGQGTTGLRVDGIHGTASDAPVPEASSTVSLGLLLMLGLGGIVLARRRRVCTDARA